MIKRYVITGGPGAGKTAVLNALKSLGFNCVDEHSRKLIEKALKEGSDLVPWKRLADFNEALVKEQLKDYLNVKQGIHFFDRGFPDNIAFFKHTRQEIPKIVQEFAIKYKYEPLVFLTPPWKEIYLLDNVRKESFEDAVIISKFIKQTYEDLGYEVIELPKASVKERAEFIKKNIDDAQL